MDTPESSATRLRRATPALVVALLVLAVTVGQVAGTRAVREQLPDAHRTVATVLEVVEAPAARSAGPPRSAVRATWTGPTGEPQVGTLVLDGRPDPGNSRTIWTDGGGAPVRVPIEATTAGLSAASLVLLLGAAALLGARVWTTTVEAERDRHALAAEWAAVEPLWSGRGGVPGDR
ncbi:hypothetical protein WIS52_27330 [Pseudonocardia nematodicida]|uniref:Transmembrane protein n=1 Tax=Pseudonocardia nematodicida TaxID=1206997 RepID=A0ABV1KJ39_9PSEU